MIHKSLKTSEGSIIVNTELPTCYSAYCSQAATKEVTKYSKFSAFDARKKIKNAGLALTFRVNELRLSSPETHPRSHKLWLQNLPLQSEDTVPNFHVIFHSLILDEVKWSH